MSSLNNRKVYLDLMRVIASYLVILIHAFVYNQENSFSNQDPSLLICIFYNIVARWAVPCFVMISGMMFLNNNKEMPLKKLYTKYVLRMVVSYLFWSVVYTFFNCYFEAGDTLKEKILYIYNYLFCGEIHMWYVLMIIGLYVASPVIKYIVNNAPKKLIQYWIWAMFVFASLIPFISKLGIFYLSSVVEFLNTYIDIQFLCGYTLYFVLGFYFSKYELSNKAKKYIYILGGCGFIYCVLILIVFKYFMNLEMGALDYMYPNIIFMSCAVLLFFMDYVSKIKFKEKTQKFIIGLSKLTYGIFLIHILVLKVLYHLGINIAICNAALSAPLISLITFVVAAVIVFVISKISFINIFVN